MKPIKPNEIKPERIKPISPEEVDKNKTKCIPPQVIEAFNELITKYYHDGCAAIKLNEAVTLVCQKMGCSKNTPCDEHWMDIEGIYMNAGWNVEFDNPGYNETYSATYYFTRKKLKEIE